MIWDRIPGVYESSKDNISLCENMNVNGLNLINVK